MVDPGTRKKVKKDFIANVEMLLFYNLVQDIARYDFLCINACSANISEFWPVLTSFFFIFIDGG